jgi:hypothetical protein
MADSKLSLVPLTPEQRCGHLPQVFLYLAARLRAALPFGARGPLSPFAANRGLTRRQQADHRRLWPAQLAARILEWSLPLPS